MTTLLGTMAGDPTEDVQQPEISGGIVPVASQAADAVTQPAAQNATPSPAPAQGGSRLARIIQAVAGVASTALAGVPNKGRPSFVTGLGEGARAEKANIANQQAIKFKNFDDQVRLAQLHNQDLKMQQDTQAQKDAHVKAELDNRALANSLGIRYDTIASDGDAVMDHLTAQTAGPAGAASIPPGTHLSGDGENVNIPSNDSKTQEGQKQMYQMLAPALGLPSLQPNMDFVPPKWMDILTNKLHGFNIDGSAPKHQDLPGLIGAEQAQRDQLAKNGATPQQLQAVDNRIAILKSNLKALDEHANEQADLAAKRQTQQKITLQNNAAKNKAANAKQPDTTELNAVAFDPNYQNPDGTKGANVVMSKTDAQAKGLTHYKADPAKLNTVVAGMNDVQNKLNQLADVVTDPQRMSQVDPVLAAAMLSHGTGITLNFGGHGGGASGGIGVDTSKVNEYLYAKDVRNANQATRDYVTAMVAAHEAVTQLPRLQTFGQSNRMTEKQMEAAVNLLPQPGDWNMAAQKMTSLQGMIDPLRKQIPHMPGAESIPSWVEQRQQRQRQNPSAGSNLSRVISGNGSVTDYINSLQPTTQ